jgi:RNA 2',3'-cyclic 3'-phosphodiesterase
MPRRLRTFVALRCSAPVSRRLRAEADRLAALDAGFHAPRTDAFHLTLQFLGETESAGIPAISRALAEAAHAVPGPLEVAYGGLGAFPVPARARVVWAAARTPEAPGVLGDLAQAVGAALGPLGFPPEARAFHPHVTLGRLRRRPSAPLAAAVEAGREADLGAEVVSDLKLILSDPSGGAYRYIDLTTVGLG